MAAIACGSDDEVCSPVEQTGCDSGQVCEEVEGEDPACFAPVVAEGTVVALADGSPIEGARVVALDVNRAPASSVAATDGEGHYALVIPSPRHADGTPVGAAVTLRGDATGFQSFPGGLRQALPVDTGAAVAEDGRWVLRSPLTELGLIAVPAGTATGVVRGRVEVPEDRVGVMVVAEPADGSARGLDAIADRDGSYAIFNVPAGSLRVDGYALGHVYERATLDLVDGAAADVDLALSDAAPGSVAGMVGIVNAPGGSATSVVLFVESTFDEAVLRGAAPPGLRAPEAGIAPNVSGAFTIDGVPPGRYVVLAAFENDGLVRDPDSCIAGTDIVHVEVGAGQAVALEDAFKVTEALAVGAPGAEDAEVVTATPTLTWADDSSEDLYRVRVYDSFGNEVWSRDVAGVSGGTPEVTYDGPLASGMYYQFRVTSVRETSGKACEIATTEDLRGVFYVP